MCDKKDGDYIMARIELRQEDILVVSRKGKHTATSWWVYDDDDNLLAESVEDSVNLMAITLTLKDSDGNLVPPETRSYAKVVLHFGEYEVSPKFKVCESSITNLPLELPLHLGE